MKPKSFKLFNLRPLFLVAVSYAAGIVIARHFAPPFYIWPAGCILSGVLFLFYKKIRYGLIIAVCTAAVVIGTILGYAALYPRYAYTPENKKEVVTGTLAQRTEKSGKWTKAVIEDCRINGNKLDYKILLYLRNEIDAEVGDKIKFKAKLQIPETFDDFDYRIYLLSFGIVYTAFGEDVTIEKMPTTLAYLPGRIASYISKQLDRLYKDEAPVIAGMLLGDDSRMSEEVISDFRTIGVAHILSVSGLHVGFMATVAVFLASRAKLNRFVKLAMVLVLVWSYGLIVGMPPAAARACIMTTCVVTASVLGYKPDLLNAIAASALVILIINPAQLFTLGFQLSFAAVLGIALLYSSIKKALKVLPKSVSSSLAVSLSAQLGVTPVSAAAFGNMQPAAVIANLPIVPLASFITIGSLFSCILAAILPPAGEALAWVIGLASRLMRVISDFLAGLPFAQIEVARPNEAAIIVWLIALFAASPYYLAEKKAKLITTVVLFALAIGLYAL